MRVYNVFTVKEQYKLGMNEHGNLKGGVILAREYTDVGGFAKKTGGRLLLKENIPWEIMYESGSILLCGFPEKLKDVLQATPFLEIKYPKRSGITLAVDTLVLSDKQIKSVSPGIGYDNVVMGITFSDGNFSEFQVPVENAGRKLLKARGMARQESKRFTNSPMR
jgi:hypothetical protein